MKKIAWIGIAITLITIAFAAINLVSLTDFDFTSVKSLIDRSIKVNGIKQTLLDFLTHAYEEEMIYRGPLLFIFLISLRRLEKFQKITAWLLLIYTTFLWTISIHSHYPWIVQVIVFNGGLINGCCIIYFKNKVFGLLTAIFLHGAVNAAAIGFVYYFLI